MARLGERRARGDQGASSIELAILGPTVIVLTLIVVQFALWFHAKNVAQSAAEQGARAARGYQATNADGSTAATAAFATLGGSQVAKGLQVSVSRNTSDVSVHVHANSIAVIPWVNIPVDVTAGGPIEQFVAP